MKKLQFLSGFILLATFSLGLLASDIRLTWNASPTPGVTNYMVYGWTNMPPSNLPAFKIDVGTNLTAVVGDLTTGTWRFAVAAATQQGVESDFSNIVIAEVPEPPAQLRIVLLEYNASLTSTNWQDVGFFRVKIQ